MATRTFIATNALVDGSNNPIVGRTIPATLLVPGSVQAVDTDGNAVLPDAFAAVTNGSGTYALTLIYPGDLSPAGCVWSIDEAGSGVLSPTSFAYASTITVTAWYTAGGPAGTVKCCLNVVLGNDAPVSDRFIHLTPQQNTQAPDGRLLSVSIPVDVLLDGTGRATFWLWPTNSLSPNTLYTCRIDGETARLSFSVPASTSDPFGENILLHTAPFGLGQTIPFSPTSVGADLAGAVAHGTLVTLADQLEQIQFQLAILAMAGSHGRQTLGPLAHLI